MGYLNIGSNGLEQVQFWSTFNYTAGNFEGEALNEIWKTILTYLETIFYL